MPHRPRRRSAARVATAALSGLTLLATTLGLPAVLIAVAGNPFAPIPGTTSLWAALTTPDSGALFLRALALVAWIGWASFAAAVAVEIPAQLRGRTTVRIPLLGVQQRMAAALVAGLAATLVAPAALTAAINPSPAAAAPAAVVVSVHGDTTDRPTTTVAAAWTEHVVQRGQSLPSIADANGVTVADVARLTYGVAQPGGQSLQPGQLRVYPGWTVRIPRSSPAVRLANVTTTPTTAAASRQALVYQPVHGDWLGGIAQRYLGDFNRYPEIAALNPQLEARDHRFPDHIEPGPTWQITLPADAYDRGPTRHATGTLIHTTPATRPAQPGAGGPTTQPGPAQPATTPPVATPTPTPASTATPTPTTSPTPMATPTPTATPAPSPSSVGAAPTPTGRATAAPTQAPADLPADPEATNSSNVVPVVAALAGLTSAGLLAALILSSVSRHRRRQQQHRQPRRRATQPRGGITERNLRVVEQPADVSRLDHALRHLTVSIARTTALPDPVGAWIIDGEIRLILTTPHDDPPQPWHAKGSEWILPARAELPDAPDVAVPTPALVTVGSRDGRHLLLDLERLGGLTIAGPPDQVADLLRFMASELACNTWSDDAELILVGFDDHDGEHLVTLNPDRVRIAPSVHDALTRAGRRIDRATATLANIGAADPLAGRVHDLAADSWQPHLVVIARSDDADLADIRQHQQRLDGAGRCGVAVVIAAPTQPIPGNILTLAPGGSLQLSSPLVEVTTAAAALPASELAALAELLRHARSVPTQTAPPAAEPEPWAVDTDTTGGILDLFDQATPTDQAPTDNRDDPDDTDESANTTAVPARTAAAIPSAEPRNGQRITVSLPRRPDPDLDRDLDAWQNQDPTRPRIAILGPVEIAAPGPRLENRQQFHGEVIVFLAARGSRGADRHQLEDALWPDKPVSEGALRTAISRVRGWLGETPDGQPWLPDMTANRTYRLADGVLLDWNLFRRLRTRGEARGSDGTPDLKAALELVRGAPLDGADRAYAANARNPYTWLAESDIFPPHITSAVIDTAHRLAQLSLDTGDTLTARWAAQQAWTADPYRADDEPWHDIMRAEHADGHTTSVRRLLNDLMRTRDAEIPEDLRPDTYELIRTLLPDLFRPTASAPR